MSDTVLEHPLVREYLRELSAACASLPVAQARELREQILAHLAEALPPDATGEQVVDELGRLGSPRMLAADAAGPAPRSLATRLLVRLARVRWWTWAAIAVLVPTAGTGIWFLTSMESATPLTYMSVTWLYHADAACSVATTADEITQETVPIRPGQRQGIEVLLVNPGDYTQTVLGPDPRWQPFGGVQVTVQSGPDINPLGVALSGGSTYEPQGAIAPGTARWVHVSWTSSYAGNSGLIFDSIRLQVRVGLITRTEVIPFFGQAMALLGYTKCGQLPG
jgi:hypothetical protein